MKFKKNIFIFYKMKSVYYIYKICLNYEKTVNL